MVTQCMIPMVPWYNRIEMNSSDTKLMSRIRSGHCYDKRFRYIIGVEENDLCDECGVLEDYEHIITGCVKYEDTRQKYNLVRNITNLSEQLGREDNVLYKQICSFIKETGIKI